MNKRIFISTAVLSSTLMTFMFFNATVEKTKTMTFNCNVKNGSGCFREIKCPTGYAPVKARIACNLEKRDHFLSQISSVPYGQISVLRESDNVTDGKCSMNDVSLMEGSAELPALDKTYGDFTVYCNERDGQSGADCSVAGEVVCTRHEAPMFENKLKFRDFRPPQGVAKLDAKNWIATQDIDRSDTDQRIRFSLLNEWGDVVRDWDMTYGSHGQSIYISKATEGYNIYVEAAAENGIAHFTLSADLTQMKFVREFPLLLNGSPVQFRVFGADVKNNRLGLFYKSDAGKKTINILELSSALEGKAVVKATFGVSGSGSLQGAALEGNFMYVLYGDTSLDTPKTIQRYGIDGKTKETYNITVGINAAKREGTKYEPEALHIDNGTLYFAILTDTTSRFYRAPANFTPAP